MKKLLILITLSLLCFTSKAQLYFVTNNLAASNHLFVANSVVPERIVLFSTNATPTIVRLFDGAITNVVGANTNYVTYPTNVVVIYTNSTGTTNTFTNRVIYTAAIATVNATNAAVPIAAYVVPANNIQITITDPLIFARQFRLSNDLAGLSAVLSYRLP